MEYNLTEEELRGDIAVVDIFFEEMSYLYIKQVPAYEFLTFLADFGGQLGLCLGASLLSTYEMVEYIFLAIWKSCRPGQV
ncbi:acid-sensing ion channel 1B-like [Glandiceps talaboti]